MCKVSEFVNIYKNHPNFIELQENIFEVIYRILELPKQN